MTATSASAGRTATFLLRQQRQTRGFRLPLADHEPHQGPADGAGIAAAAGAGQFGEPEAGVPRGASGEERPAAGPGPVLTLLEIPPGFFTMGSPHTERQRSADEGPQRLVELAGFMISQTPITQAQWRAVATWRERPGERWQRPLQPNPSRFQWRQGDRLSEVRLEASESNTDQRPVERVSWWEAMEFCHRLNQRHRQRTGRHYSLPSEAQWEYACRAGTTTAFHFGATITPQLANYLGNHTYATGPVGNYRKQTTPVGMFPANSWGLHDMHGNVLEWCLDHWHRTYKGAPTDGSAWLEPDPLSKRNRKDRQDTTDASQLRLLRGGSWFVNPRNCRSACRNHFRPDFASLNVGFRVVCLPQDASLNP